MSDRDRKRLDESGLAPDARQTPSSPQRAIQRRETRLEPGSAARVHAAAEKGISGTGRPLPYLETIQRAFGKHDVTHVRAHTDAAAAEGAAAMNAEAFATDKDVAFAGAPSLHTAAHEAAHVVQQRRGVHLKGGVGEVGDAYEQHADAVADAVVAGRSAESLLDLHSGSGRGSASSVQRITKEVLASRGTQIESLASQSNVPEEGMNLWLATKDGTTIHLLGTHHKSFLHDMKASRQIVDFLQTNRFTHVYTEKETALPSDVRVVPNLGALAQDAHEEKQKIDKQVANDQRENIDERQRKLNMLLAGKNLVALQAQVPALRLKLDVAYAFLASSHDGHRPDARTLDKWPVDGNWAAKHGAAAAGAWRDANVEGAARTARDNQGLPDEDQVKKNDRAGSSDENDKTWQNDGNQKAIFQKVVAEMKEGYDISDQEERNIWWMEIAVDRDLKKDDKQLWIVGADHLPGLILHFQARGFHVAHIPAAASASSSSSSSSSSGTAATAHGADDLD